MLSLPSRPWLLAAIIPLLLSGCPRSVRLASPQPTEPTAPATPQSLPPAIPTIPPATRPTPHSWSDGRSGVLAGPEVWFASSSPARKEDGPEAGFIDGFVFGHGTDPCFYQAVDTNARRLRSWRNQPFDTCPGSWLFTDGLEVVQIIPELRLRSIEEGRLMSRWSNPQIFHVLTAPVVVDRTLVGRNDHDLIGISLEDGTELWRQQTETMIQMQAVGTQLVALERHHESGTASLRRLDSTLGAELFRHQLERWHTGFATAGMNALLIDERELRFIELEQGVVRALYSWQMNRGDGTVRGDQNGFAVAAPNHLSSWTPDGTHRWTHTLPLAARPHLAVFEDIILVFTAQEPSLLAFDRETGALNWQLPTPPGPIQVNEHMILIENGGVTVVPMAQFAE